MTEDWTADSVVVAALGRPLDLGMLYDCRSDSFCSDVSLWDNSTIAFMRQSLPRPLTEVKCIEGDSLQDRFRALDVTTPLRASVLSGLVEVGGAAGYLKHPVQSTLQDRVTLHYRTTTRLDMLSHSVLQEETDRTQQKATHVVMAVLYGAQAFFIFDYKHISGQHSGAGEADMHSVVKKMMPTFSAGQIFSSLSDTEKLNSLLYRCNLYSDVDYVNGSMTYDRALQVYETLPKHLGQQGEKAVPLYAWLYPVKNLGLSVETTRLFFTKAEGVLDHLRQATMRCQEMRTDFTNGCVMKWFPDLTYKLSRLSELLQKYQSEFKRKLSMAVKTMRESEGVDENRLRDILQNHDQSPFCPQSIQLWLNNKAAEVKALNDCKTRNIPIMISQEELDGVLRSSKDRLLCFTLTSLEDEDPFLSTMKQHKHSLQENTVNQTDLTGQQETHSVPMDTVNQSDLTGQQETHSVQENIMNQSDLTGQQETKRPFKPPDLTQKIQSDLCLFTKSYEDSGDGESIKFIAAVIPDISVPGSSIRLYQQGSLITTNFQLGLEPDPFQVAETKQSCVLLKFPQSTIRRPERYRVEYRVMTTGVSKVSKRPWNVVDTLAPAETCLVPRLKPFALYQIRYSVIEHSGMSDFSKVIEVMTLRSPPEQLFVNRLDKETVKVTWLQPECDDGASVLHYKVDYKESGLEGWSTMVTEGPECQCIITLNLSTCYRVRVSAVYGEGDTSEPSRETDVPVYGELHQVNLT
ncbi:stonustoxin subunit beta-like [Salvelinus namaycush]|uniref:Stonustoxin subunit beta-like n=1 Tax=Salvelinus namaycush TaxID=8040 RepID=A0A8U0QGI2_SALNM|nr:stonustoxin subunit beta-like [Salvelinus namaycush]